MITPLSFVGGWFGQLLGSKVFWEIALTLVLVIGAWRFVVHEQELGATREHERQQAQQMAVQAAQAKATIDALTQRAAAAEAAQARSQAAQRRYQEAMTHDRETIDWRAVCGARRLPCRVLEYVEGRVPPECAAKPDPPHAGTSP